MKHIVLFLAMVVITVSSFAQSTDKQQEDRKNLALKYVEIATEEFNLTEAQQTAVYERKLQHLKEQSEAKVQFKNGKITKEEKKIPNQKFNKFLRKLTGKNYKELEPFNKKVYKELYN
jgi:type II secretory pathway pseudopilin PulG